MYGKTYMGVERSTFLIDADGRIAGVWRKVKVPGHAEAVLQAVKTKQRSWNISPEIDRDFRNYAINAKHVS